LGFCLLSLDQMRGQLSRSLKSPGKRAGRWTDQQIGRPGSKGQAGLKGDG